MTSVVLVLGIVWIVLALRSQPVDVQPPAATGATKASCNRLSAALPASIETQSRRETSPESALTEAWGDPAIVLRCGVPRPSALAPTSEVVSVDEVEWFPVEDSAGYTFTTVGRTVYVEVRVPSSYAPEVNVLTDLADAISTIGLTNPSGN